MLHACRAEVKVGEVGEGWMLRVVVGGRVLGNHAVGWVLGLAGWDGMDRAVCFTESVISWPGQADKGSSKCVIACGI